MNPKLRRSLPTIWVIVSTLALGQLWMWSFDHLPRWEAFLVLLGILGGLWVVGRSVQHRREATKARSAEASHPQRVAD